jgi:hypothetical protein
VKHARPLGCNLRHRACQQATGGPIDRNRSSHYHNLRDHIPFIAVWQLASCITGTGADKMRKILIGLVAAIAVATAGFFGFQFYVQHRVATQIEAAFEQIRAGGGKASHGKVSFDPWSRTVIIADIAGESAAQPALVVKIASVTARGASEKDGTRFSADASRQAISRSAGDRGACRSRTRYRDSS